MFGTTELQPPKLGQGPIQVVASTVDIVAKEEKKVAA